MVDNSIPINTLNRRYRSNLNRSINSSIDSNDSFV